MCSATHPLQISVNDLLLMQIPQSICKTKRLAGQSGQCCINQQSSTDYMLPIDMRMTFEIVHHITERTVGGNKGGKWTKFAGYA